MLRETSPLPGYIFPHARWLKFPEKGLQHPPHQAHHHLHRSTCTRKDGNLLLQLPTPTWITCTHLVAAATQAASAIPSEHKASPDSWCPNRAETAQALHPALLTLPPSHSCIFFIPECTFPCRMMWMHPAMWTRWSAVRNTTALSSSAAGYWTAF